MEADSDDIATDFGNEQIEITPGDKNTLEEDEKDDWDESKFEKSLNNQIMKDQIGSKNQSRAKEDQGRTSELKVNEVVLNDKNIMAQSIGRGKEESEQVEQNPQIALEPLEMDQQLKAESQQTITKFQRLQIDENLNESKGPNQQSNEYKVQQTLQVALLSQQPYAIKQYTTQPEYISKFCPSLKSPTIKLNQALDQAQQSKHYFENLKIALTEPITSMNSETVFRLDNIKYCVGVGVGVQEILEKHEYDYKSTTSTEMGHGLYVVTTQGYSWSHSQQNDDDVFRQGFNQLYSGVNMKVKLQGENLSFQWKKGSFSMELPSRIRHKYTLCFCAYLHEKTDAVSLVPQ